MPRRNTSNSYGSVARWLHWATALLILIAIPLGLIANGLGYETPEALALKTTLFSAHKTLGIAAFAVAILRVLWALSQTHPAPLHPARKLESFAASLVHWLLYVAMLAVPASGWLHHAAVTGFAPIWWPLGQGLPFVPQSETLASVASFAHWLFTKLLFVALGLHVVGAFKHQLIDRDATLARMWRGAQAPAHPGNTKERAKAKPLPMLGALAVVVVALTVIWTKAAQAPAAVTPAMAMAPASGNWQVTQGNLRLSVQQMGQAIGGQFDRWQADITFDETAAPEQMGAVEVRIETGSLQLGSVSDAAKGDDFFAAAAFPEAIFRAQIKRAPQGAGYLAEGTLSLRGIDLPLTLPFDLVMSPDQAQMTGALRLDRRDFGMGAQYSDESTVGFGVEVQIDLTATRP